MLLTCEGGGAILPRLRVVRLVLAASLVLPTVVAPVYAGDYRVERDAMAAASALENGECSKENVRKMLQWEPAIFEVLIRWLAFSRGRECPELLMRVSATHRRLGPLVQLVGNRSDFFDGRGPLHVPDRGDWLAWTYLYIAYAGSVPQEYLSEGTPDWRRIVPKNIIRFYSLRRGEPAETLDAIRFWSGKAAGGLSAWAVVRLLQFGARREKLVTSHLLQAIARSNEPIQRGIIATALREYLSALGSRRLRRVMADLNRQGNFGPANRDGERRLPELTEREVHPGVVSPYFHEPAFFYAWMVRYNDI